MSPGRLMRLRRRRMVMGEPGGQGPPRKPWAAKWRELPALRKTQKSRAMAGGRQGSAPGCSQCSNWNIGLGAQTVL